jgi:gas vesicle protein GvpL/GvpF
MAVESPTRADTGLYCYGVVAARDTQSPIGRGLDGEPVQTVAHDGLAALVSDAPGNLRAKRRDLLAHFEVLGAAFEHGTVLPLRFGIVFDDEEALVRDFLAPRQKELAKLLNDLRDQVELRVTAHYRADALLAEVVRDSPRVSKLREATRTAAAAGHPAMIELGELVAAEVQARTARDARQLVEKLRPTALRYELDEEPIEYQLLRGSFLVERKRVPKFEAALEAFAADNAGRVDVKYVGPLPPHSFVELTHEGRR